MVAQLKSILFSLLLVTSTTNLIPSSLAAPTPAPAPAAVAAPAPAPAPAPQIPDKDDFVEISYREGRFGEIQNRMIELPTARLDDDTRERVAYHEIKNDRSGETLYDVNLLIGPEDAYCGFMLAPSSLPLWIPGQTRTSDDWRTFSNLSPVDGPVRNVRYIWCRTRAGT